MQKKKVTEVSIDRVFKISADTAASLFPKGQTVEVGGPAALITVNIGENNTAYLIMNQKALQAFKEGQPVLTKQVDNMLESV